MKKIISRKFDYSDDELLQWHDLILEFYDQCIQRPSLTRHKGVSKFCRSKGISAVKFNWFQDRFYYKSRTAPELHIRHIEIAKSFIESGLPKIEFCEKYKADASALSKAHMHLIYRGRLDKLLENRPPPLTGFANLSSEIKERMSMAQLNIQNYPPEEDAMSFFPVPVIANLPANLPDHVPDHVPESEIIRPKNKIELKAAGVNVTIASELGTEKLIKIIEFLEGL
jgi:hypothetical protein